MPMATAVSPATPIRPKNFRRQARTRWRWDRPVLATTVAPAPQRPMPTTTVPGIRSWLRPGVLAVRAHGYRHGITQELMARRAGLACKPCIVPIAMVHRRERLLRSFRLEATTERHGGRTDRVSISCLKVISARLPEKATIARFASSVTVQARMGAVAAVLGLIPTGETGMQFTPTELTTP